MEIGKHIKTLQTMVALLMDNNTRSALLLWNGMHAQPPLKDMKISGDGEVLRLDPVVGEPIVVSLESVIEELDAAMAQLKPEL